MTFDCGEQNEAGTRPHALKHEPSGIQFEEVESKRRVWGEVRLGDSKGAVTLAWATARADLTEAA